MSEKLFYTMGEVAEMFDVNQSLIRYWESQFRMLRPKRNKKGNRLFTPEDIRNLKLIYHLVKERGMTLEGAKKALRKHSADDPQMNRDAELVERLQHIRSLLEEVREELKEESAGEVVAEDRATETSRAAGRRPQPARRTMDEAAAPEADTTPEAEADSGTVAADSAAEPGDAASRRTARRPRRKKEEVENKELFAFYEQSLF